MRLKTFQVLNFRSVNDSGVIDIGPRTVLVGRNESGKTNLLLALHSLNPPGGLRALSYVKDFPRHRGSAEFDENLVAVKTVWALDSAESAELERIFPRAAGLSEVGVERPYKAARQVRFHGLPPLAVNRDNVEKQARGLERAFKNLLKDCADNALVEKAGRALSIVLHEIGAGLAEPAEWAARLLKVAPVFRQSCAALKLELPENAAAQLQAIEDHARELAADKDQYQHALNWVSARLPVFVYLSEYPQINGHQNLKALALRLEKNQLEDADQDFLRLCKAAELDPLALVKMLATDHQHRQVLANRAGAVITKKLRELWSDRPLKVRFNLDAEHFDTLVSEPNDLYDVEVNLDERSRGFKWFFSFYVTFAAGNGGGPPDNAVLLLDEPGMYLHAVAQRDLLAHFREFAQPIIYTTHSPFMVPAAELGAVRTVGLDPEQGTWVSNQPSGDANTLFPVRAALGYELTRALFGERPAVLLESLSDFWYLDTLLGYFRAQGRAGLPEFDLVPAGGARALASLAALLTGQAARAVVLVKPAQSHGPHDPALWHSHLLPTRKLLLLDTVFAPEAAVWDIEDLLDAPLYEALVKSAYAQELAGREVVLDAALPGSLARYREAFRALGLAFDPARPALRFVREFAQAPETWLGDAAAARFMRLFAALADAADMPGFYTAPGINLNLSPSPQPLSRRERD